MVLGVAHSCLWAEQCLHPFCAAGFFAGKPMLPRLRPRKTVSMTVARAVTHGLRKKDADNRSFFFKKLDSFVG